MDISHVNINKIFFEVTTILFGLISYESMLFIDNTANITSHLWEYFGLLFIILALLWLNPFIKLKQQTSLLGWQYLTFITLSLGWVFLILIMLPAPQMSFNGRVIRGAISFIPVLAYIVGYTYTRNNDLSPSVYLCFFIIYILLCIQYLHIYLMVHDDGSFIGVSYFPLILFPLIMLFQNKAIKYLALVITIAIIFSSVKRGGMVALIFALIVYIFVKQLSNNNHWGKSLSIIIFSLLILGGLFYYLNDFFNTSIVDRFAGAANDGGSGRLDIWADIFFQIHQNSFSDLLIGNGYLASTLTNMKGLSAHNDFLEILYDFGLIGLIPYFISIIILTSYNIRMIRIRSISAAPLAMATTIYIILSMISIVILYTSLSLFLFEFGIMIGLCEKEFAKTR